MVSASTWHACEVQKPKSSVGNAETVWWRFASLTGTSLQHMPVISVKLEPHYSSAGLPCHWTRSGKRTSCSCWTGLFCSQFPPRLLVSVCLSVCLSLVLQVLTDWHKFFRAFWKLNASKFRIVGSLFFRRLSRKNVFCSHYYHLINKHRLSEELSKSRYQTSINLPEL